MFNYNYNPFNYNQNNGINNIKTPEKSEVIKDSKSNQKDNKKLPYKENTVNIKNEYSEIDLNNINIKVPNEDINIDKISNLDAPKIICLSYDDKKKIMKVKAVVKIVVIKIK